MDFNVSLRRAIKTGDVILGQNQTEQCINEGKRTDGGCCWNCPEKFRKSLCSEKDCFCIPSKDQASSSVKACGKPFMVSALTVVDPGESDLLNLKRAMR